MPATLIITQPPAALAPLASLLANRGLHLAGHPFIETQPQPFVMPDLQQVRWLFFTSQTAVKAFFAQVSPKQRKRLLGTHTMPSIAVVGPKTAQAVEAAGYTVSFVAPTANAKAAANAFLDTQGTTLSTATETACPILWPCGDKALPDLAEVLSAAEGCQLTALPVYGTQSIRLSEEKRTSLMASLRQAQGILFTSPSNVLGWMSQQPALPELSGLDILSLGPSTTQALKQYQLPVTMEAPTHTVYGAIEAYLFCQQKEIPS